MTTRQYYALHGLVLAVSYTAWSIYWDAASLTLLAVAGVVALMVLPATITFMILRKIFGSLRVSFILPPLAVLFFFIFITGVALVSDMDGGKLSKGGLIRWQVAKSLLQQWALIIAPSIALEVLYIWRKQPQAEVLKT